MGERHSLFQDRQADWPDRIPAGFAVHIIFFFFLYYFCFCTFCRNRLFGPSWSGVVCSWLTLNERKTCYDSQVLPCLSGFRWSGRLPFGALPVPSIKASIYLGLPWQPVLASHSVVVAVGVAVTVAVNVPLPAK